MTIMNIQKITQQLQYEYPGKKITVDDTNHPAEIIGDIEPAHEHSLYSAQVCVINETAAHYHKKTAHIYYVLRGTLVLFVNDTKYTLQEDEFAVVEPGQLHWTKGNETWVELYSEPGVSREDTFIPTEKIETPAENTVLIQLETRDMGKTKTFYEQLGFKTIWEKVLKNKNFLVLKQSSNVLCFSQGGTNKTQSVQITVMSANLKEIYDLAQKNTPPVNEPAINGLGVSSFTVKDPNGYEIIFTEPFNILNPR